MINKLYQIFIFFLISGPLFSEITPVVLKDKSDRYKIGLNLYILEDPNNSLSIHEIESSKWKNKFKKSTVDIPNFGLSSSSFWVKLKIRNNSGQKKWNLIYKHFRQDHIDFYFKKEGSWELETRGDLYSFDSRKIKSRFFIFEISPNKDTVYYLKVRGTTTQINVEIQSKIETFHEEGENNFGFGILFGFIFIMFFYNLFILIATKDISYLHYIFYVLFYGLTLLTTEGFGFQFVFPDYPWFSNQGVGLFGGFSSLFTTTFTMTYLEINRSEHKKLFNLFLVFIFSCILVIVFSLFFRYSISLFSLMANTLFILPTLLIINFHFYLRGFKPSKYYILAFSSMILGTIVKVLMTIGFFQANFFTSNAALIGTCIQMVLLSMGLAYKFNYQQELSLENEKNLSDLLEESRQGLERKVKEKTEELDLKNKDLEIEKAQVELFLQNSHKQKMRMKYIMNNLEQGYLTIDKKGVIQQGATKITEKLLETNLHESENKGLKIWDVIFKKPIKRDSLKKWIHIVFEGRLPFKDLNQLAPKSFEGTKGRYVELEFRPIYEKRSKTKISNLILIASDKTNELNLQKKLELDKENVTFVNNCLKSPVDFVDLVDDTYSILDSYRDNFQNKEELFRSFHTLKARWGLFGVNSLINLLNVIESVIDKNELDKLNIEIYSFRLSFQDFLKKNHTVVQAANKFMVEEGNAIEVSKLFSIIDETDSLNTLRSHIQKNYILTDIKEKFSRYKQLIDEIAKEQGKVIDFQIKGDKVLVDYSIFSNLIDTSIHIFRNMVDHGIETEDERIEKTKSQKGVITVEFISNGDNFIINMNDDGRGINTKKIKQKLLKNELMPEDNIQKLDESELINSIFLPGLSTKEQVSYLSGRGIGMDAVRDEVEKLGGNISVTSKIDEGTKFSITLPYVKKE